LPLLYDSTVSSRRGASASTSLTLSASPHDGQTRAKGTRSVIALRTPEEIEKIRLASRLVAEAHVRIKEHLKPGITTLELDELVRDSVLEFGGSLLFLNYRGFPAHACISINEEVVHGIPRRRRRLKDGDIVSVDIGVRYKGYCGDSAWTHRVGEVGPEAERLLQVGEEALQRGIDASKVGAKVSDIGRAIQTYVEGEGLEVVKQFVGHGIGTKLHEEPQVPNYVDVGLFKPDPILKSGMVLAIEPMVNAGTGEVETLDDGWTVVTADRHLSVHFEHTVAVLEEGPTPLTVPEGALPAKVAEKS
jgi:methionyl aminopeptidase